MTTIDHRHRVLLIVGGGIAAYKALELVRLLQKRGIAVRAVLTESGARFVTPLSLQALTADKVHDSLWSLTDESEMGHIELSRSADLVVVAPATADLLAKMEAGLAGDLATTVLMATDKPVLVAPAMNVRMWEHAATRANCATLRNRGIGFVDPDEGEMACGEYGFGRLAAPERIAQAIEAALAVGASATRPLAGKRAIVTSGPTHEAIDPVRYLGNHSSGRQGHAVAGALARLGAEVTLVSGPTALPDPAGCRTVRVTTAEQMLAACQQALPADIVVCAAAVADWRPAGRSDVKLTKENGTPSLTLVENVDIVHTLAHAAPRPRLVVGFAAETGDLVARGQSKRRRKGCDWVLANPIDDGAVFGAADNQITFISDNGVEEWPLMAKEAVAARLAQAIAAELSGKMS